METSFAIVMVKKNIKHGIPTGQEKGGHYYEIALEVLSMKKGNVMIVSFFLCLSSQSCSFDKILRLLFFRNLFHFYSFFCSKSFFPI